MNKELLYKILFILAVDASLLSQTTNILLSGADNYFKIVWLLPFAALFLSYPQRFLRKSFLPFYLFVIFFAAYCFIMDGVSLANYVNAHDLINIVISVAIMVLSYVFFSSVDVDDRFINILCVNLMICGVIMGIDVYNNYFSAGYDLEKSLYLYKQKNSMGHILVSLCIIVLMLFRTRYKLKKVLSYLFIIFMLYLVIIMKARATIFGLIFVILFFVLRSRNRRAQISVVVVLLLSMVLLLSNPKYFDILVNNIMLNNHDFGNVDKLSSGRLHLMAEAIDNFKGHELFGVGMYYVDNFPLNVLVQYGIVGATLVYILVLFVSIRIAFRLKLESRYGMAAELLFVLTVMNAMFEAYPPFGPGVKCFLMWLLFGFCLSDNKYIRKTA